MSRLNTTPAGTPVGTVVGNTSPHEFRFFLRQYAAKLGDLVSVGMEIPESDGTSHPVTTWARIVELGRFNPFLPAEAGQELAEEGLRLTDTVLSVSRDQIEGKALVLGYTDAAGPTNLRPLNYPVNPGGEIYLPPKETIKSILLGDEPTVPRMRLGTLIGRSDVEVKVRTNSIVARHMAILAMTGGGKTVAARRIIKELIDVGYPLLVLDPHGDYLGLWKHRASLSGTDVRLYYPHLVLNEENVDLVGELVNEMTQGLTDAQREKFYEAMGKVELRGEEDIRHFIERVIQELDSGGMQAQNKWTLPVVKRQLRLVNRQLEAMEKSNSQLRNQPSMSEFDFAPMPDPKSEPTGFIRPNRVSIIYLGGYDHLTQSTIVSIVLKQLFEHRASMSNKIPPFMTVIEEAHNFIPSRGEGQRETPSVPVIRKVITEGRKFGTGLLLISQRPSRLDETTLSQCNTFLIFRLVNPRDQNFVERVMENLSKDDSRLLPGFGPGQGIVSGQAVRFPLLIQVDYDRDLLPPNIGDEDFLQAVSEWRASTGEHTAIDDGRLERLTSLGGSV
ncbi:MAG: ATP-binding protein [Acidimicrobiales bacterium]